MQNNAESMYLCRYESEFPDSSPYQRLWQNDDCQRADGITEGKGLSGAAIQVRTRLY